MIKLKERVLGPIVLRVVNRKYGICNSRCVKKIQMRWTSWYSSVLIDVINVQFYIFLLFVKFDFMLYPNDIIMVKTDMDPDMMYSIISIMVNKMTRK